MWLIGNNGPNGGCQLATAGAYDFRVLHDLSLSLIYPANFFSEQDMSCQPKKTDTVIYFFSVLFMSSQWAAATVQQH